jgi:hypothetical protein
VSVPLAGSLALLGRIGGTPSNPVVYPNRSAVLDPTARQWLAVAHEIAKRGPWSALKAGENGAIVQREPCRVAYTLNRSPVLVDLSWPTATQATRDPHEIPSSWVSVLPTSGVAGSMVQAPAA